MAPSVLVLVVDDDEGIQQILGATLKDGGFAVAIVASGEQAITALNHKREAVHALVTDIDLGSTATGWDVARHAREITPALPVVYMTGGRAHEWSSLGVPNSVLITKPFAASRVITTLFRLLNNRSTPEA